MKTLLQSAAIGTVVTFALFGVAWLASSSLLELSYYLYWQGWVLQFLVPCNPPTDPLLEQCEPTIGFAIAFYAGLPVGIVLYSALAYAALTLRKRKAASRPAPGAPPSGS